MSMQVVLVLTVSYKMEVLTLKVQYLPRLPKQ